MTAPEASLKEESSSELVERIARWRIEMLTRVCSVGKIITVSIGAVFSVWIFFFRLSESGIWKGLWGSLVAGGLVAIFLSVGGYWIACLAIHFFYPRDVRHLPAGITNAKINKRWREINRIENPSIGFDAP